MAQENKRFPLFVNLTGRRAVVVGGGNVGLRRAEVLREFGAEVTVVSPTRARDVERMRYVDRAYQSGDLDGAFLAVAATNNREVNAAIGQEARIRGIFFNRADAPEDCDFFFPAICEGGGIVAGITGDCSDHRRTAETAKEIRKILENKDT